jgi:uncharacterized protein YegP (UPF0339 family)
MIKTKAQFVIYKDRASRWRWHLKSGNSLIVADSGYGYSRKASAHRAIVRLLLMMLRGDYNIRGV